MGHVSKENADRLIERFCDDAISALKSYDKRIRNRFKSEETNEFYMYEWQGLGAYSITEPILKWLIYTTLCDKYCMWPEHSVNGKLLDLGLSMKPSNINCPDIAIEMKWAFFRKNGEIKSAWRDEMIKDAVKLYGQKCFEHKYLIQFSFPLKGDYKFIEESIEATASCFHDYIDKRRFRDAKLTFMFNKSFNTWDAENARVFLMLVWKIEQKKRGS